MNSFGLALLAADLELLQELAEANQRIQALYEENDKLRHQVSGLINRLFYATEFDLSADSTPCLIRKQAG